MTTVEEFNAIMQSMYDRGYVLVELSDMAGFETAEDGTQVWTEKKLLLPEGKKAFVLSQDDVSYYEYMEGDGYPSRLLIGEDGRITNEVINDDGTASYGSFDLVPLLEDFIAAHPDFSYKGARGYLALTGYDGILGYRTADKYKESLGEEEWQRQVEECKQVVNRLLEQGWEFASHSWGHLNLGQVSYSTFVSDSEKWEAQVRPLLENNGTYKVDTMIFAFGNDIGSWTPYTSQNERFLYLRDRGFHYFCNVDSSQTWVQNNSELQYLRQGRRNLDGQRMWQDMTDDSVDYLSDLFDVNAVFDQRRPTPVE
ncbi:MAG: polysaccharide deacetylase family protein [Lachnospiraceae bacterium]